MTEGKPKKQLGRKLKIGAISYASLMQRLVSDHATLHELCDHTGLHMQTIRDYVEALHKARLVHITAWMPDILGRDQTPVYSWGVGVDKKRANKSVTQRQRDYRERKKKLALQAVWN